MLNLDYFQSLDIFYTEHIFKGGEHENNIQMITHDGHTCIITTCVASERRVCNGCGRKPLGNAMYICMCCLQRLPASQYFQWWLGNPILMWKWATISSSVAYFFPQESKWHSLSYTGKAKDEFWDSKVELNLITWCRSFANLQFCPRLQFIYFDPQNSVKTTHSWDSSNLYNPIPWYWSVLFLIIVLYDFFINTRAVIFYPIIPPISTIHFPSQLFYT